MEIFALLGGTLTYMQRSELQMMPLHLALPVVIFYKIFLELIYHPLLHNQEQNNNQAPAVFSPIIISPSLFYCGRGPSIESNGKKLDLIRLESEIIGIYCDY